MAAGHCNGSACSPRPSTLRPQYPPSASQPSGSAAHLQDKRNSEEILILDFCHALICTNDMHYVPASLGAAFNAAL